MKHLFLLLFVGLISFGYKVVVVVAVTKYTSLQTIKKGRSFLYFHEKQQLRIYYNDVINALIHSPKGF